MDQVRYSAVGLKIALLRCYASERKSQSRRNVLGSPYGRGDLERLMDVDLTAEERALAHRCMQELEADALLQPTYSDAISPFDWLVITEAGKKALELNAVDQLDHLLISVDPNLIEVRHGAWTAVCSHNPDSVRQAAHSGRELLRLVLKNLAPDDEVRRATWFKGGTKIERGDRVRLIIGTRKRRVSKSALRVVEAHCALIDRLYERLSALAHDKDPSGFRDQVTRLIRTVEDALLELLETDDRTPGNGSSCAH